MEDAPTPFKIKVNFELRKELISNKNNKYLLFLKAEDNVILNIKAIKTNDFNKAYTNKFSIDKIKENKYFYQFDDLQEICDEISERFQKEKITIVEKNNSILINIPLPSSKIKEIFFELKEIEKDPDLIVKELITLVNEQKEEIEKLKNEMNELKLFKSEMSCLLNKFIINLDSLIIDNFYYNFSLKSWINPVNKIKAKLLYRMSRDGPEISTFHKLCDNKGPNLVLFDLKEGTKVGFYINDSFDSNSEWKKDNNSFIFNLNQNKKYQHINPKMSAFYCNCNCGPSANGLGCEINVKLNYICCSESSNLDLTYENGSKILPTQENEDTGFEVKEVEIFQIISC